MENIMMKKIIWSDIIFMCHERPKSTATDTSMLTCVNKKELRVSAWKCFLWANATKSKPKKRYSKQGWWKEKGHSQ